MNNSPLRRLFAAGLVLAFVDGVWACVLTAINDSTFTRLWQGVASVLLGPSAREGGTKTVLIGLLMHVGVAFFWSGVFLLLWMGSSWLRRVVDTRGGVLAVALVYGPFIWAVMSILVIPMLTARPQQFRPSWWIQLAGHAPFVGLPIVAMIGGGLWKRKSAANAVPASA